MTVMIIFSHSLLCIHISAHTDTLSHVLITHSSWW